MAIVISKKNRNKGIAALLVSLLCAAACSDDSGSDGDTGECSEIVAGGECPPADELFETDIGVKAAGYLPINLEDCLPSGCVPSDFCDSYEGVHCVTRYVPGDDYIAYVFTDAQTWEVFYQYCDPQYEPVVDWNTEHVVVFLFEGSGSDFELPTTFRMSEHENGRPHIDTFVWGINELSEIDTDCWGIGGDALVVSSSLESTVCLRLGQPCH